MSENLNPNEIIAALHLLRIHVETRKNAKILDEKLGLSEKSEIREVLVGDVQPPEGWVEIICSGCHKSGWMPPDMVPEGLVALCPRCVAALAENLP